MLGIQDKKLINIGPPTAIINTASVALLSPGYLDTKGWHCVDYVVDLGATDIALTALNVTECDTTGGSYTLIAGTDFSVSPLTLPSATDDNHVFHIMIPVNGLRMRYQKIVCTFGTGVAGGYATIVAILSNPDNAPYDHTTRGYTQEAILTA